MKRKIRPHPLSERAQTIKSLRERNVDLALELAKSPATELDPLIQLEVAILLAISGEHQALATFIEGSDAPRSHWFADLFNAGVRRFLDVYDDVHTAQLFGFLHTHFDEDEDVIINLASALKESGEVTKALALYEKYLSKYKKSGDFVYGYGNALRRAGRHDEAIEIYEQAQDCKDAAKVSILNNLALSLSDLKDYEEAVRAIEIAVRLDPLDEIVRGNYGVFLAKLKKYELALIELETAIEMGNRVGEVKRLVRRLRSRLGESA